jgi:hypothetical protein
MQKKNSKKKPPAKSLLTRAKAIIDSDAYDEDSREGIRGLLKTNDPDLADYVKRVEAGEGFYDLVAVANDHKNQAATILAFLRKAIPAYLREAVVEALTEAARRVGHPQMAPALKDGKVVVTENSNPYFQDLRENVESLVSLTQGNFSLAFSNTEKVVRATSELLHNPQTPQELFEAVAEFVCEQSNVGGNIYHSTPVLIEVLKSVPPEELRGAILEARTREEVSDDAK